MKAIAIFCAFALSSTKQLSKLQRNSTLLYIYALISLDL